MLIVSKHNIEYFYMKFFLKSLKNKFKKQHCIQCTSIVHIAMITVCSKDEIEYYLYNQFVGSRYPFRCSPVDHSFLRTRMHE